MSSPATKPHDSLPTYTAADVAKHSTLKDAWVSCNGLVYDVTAFLDKHPGGPSVVEGSLGQDIKEAMIQADHSPYAYTLLKDYTIGKLEGSEVTEMWSSSPSNMHGYTTEQVMNIIDFEKPVLPQVMSVGDKYWPWLTSRPVCHKQRIFEHNFFEWFSRYPWWYIWPTWVPVMLYHVATECMWSDFSSKQIAFSFAFGLFVWTLAEYLLHRFVFHMEVWSNLGNAFHYFAHGIHHLTPTDSTRLTFPPLFGVLLSFVVFSIWFLMMPSAVGSGKVGFAGFLLGYCCYDTAHYFFHHSDFDNKLFRVLKTAHMNHHYKNDEENFGVSSPIWDIVFGTFDAVHGGRGNKEKVQ